MGVDPGPNSERFVNAALICRENFRAVSQGCNTNEKGATGAPFAAIETAIAQ